MNKKLLLAAVTVLLFASCSGSTSSSKLQPNSKAEAQQCCEENNYSCDKDDYHCPPKKTSHANSRVNYNIGVSDPIGFFQLFLQGLGSVAEVLLKILAH